MAKNHGMTEMSGMEKFCSRGAQQTRADRFGRLFVNLPSNYTDPSVLAAIGAKHGPMDEGSQSASNRTKSVPVGQVIFGQFIDHDITLDASSSLAQNQTANDIPNVRTPGLDLDCIYGAGPEAQPYLYKDGVRLLTGADMPDASVVTSNDLLRSANKRAIIGDPRNDENRIISQMQLGFIKFHNHVCDAIQAGSPQVSGHNLFEQAREFVTWHYQWAVVFDFLTDICGRPVVEDILSDGRKVYCGLEAAFIPVEFSVAAYRFGHSMVPMKIQVQKGGTSFEFFGTALGEGFSPLPGTKAIVDWHELFDTPEGRTVQRAEKLDTLMASDLLQLPFITEGESSLATRNLLRGNVFQLPSGERVAAECGRSETEVKKVVDRVAALSTSAIETQGISALPITNGIPLWLYVLAEAEVIGKETKPGCFDPAEGLGPVGARIVAEVIIGLLELDDHSFLGSNRNWLPDSQFDSIGKILATTNSSELP